MPGKILASSAQAASQTVSHHKPGNECSMLNSNAKSGTCARQCQADQLQGNWETYHQFCIQLEENPTTLTSAALVRCGSASCQIEIPLICHRLDENFACSLRVLVLFENHTVPVVHTENEAFQWHMGEDYR